MSPAALLTLLVSVLPLTAFAGPNWVEGLPKRAPDLSKVIHVAGKQADVTGSSQPVVVEVWATWCGACLQSFPALAELHRDPGRELAVVALTDEDPIRVRRFVDARRPQIPFTVVTDPTTEASQALLFGGFGASGIPSAYLIVKGQVVWAGRVEEVPRSGF